MVKAIHGSYVIPYHPNGPDTEPALEVDFTPPFKRVHIYDDLEVKLGVKLPAPDTLHTEGEFPVLGACFLSRPQGLGRHCQGQGR